MRKEKRMNKNSYFGAYLITVISRKITIEIQFLQIITIQKKRTFWL